MLRIMNSPITGEVPGIMLSGKFRQKALLQQ